MNRQDVEKTITEYLKPIFGFALKRCKSIHDAEDLSQEITIRAFRALLIKDDVAKYIKNTNIEAGVGSVSTSTVGSNLVGFRQINTPILAGFEQITASNAFVSLDTKPFTCNTSTTKKCHIRLAETLVRMDVYNQVLSRFINQPMLFPIQSIISKDFSGEMPNSDKAPINMTMTNALNHCNSMFIVFKKIKKYG